MAENHSISFEIQCYELESFKFKTEELNAKSFRPVAALESVQSCFEFSLHFSVIYRKKTE